MVFIRVLVLVLGTLVTSNAVAQTAQSRAAGSKSPHYQKKLVSFVEAGGCRLLATERVVRRLKEIDAQGKVTWDGSCKHGLIDGRGVLREEGSVVIGGKTKNYAYHLSGNAKNGLRSGRWKRETFDMFVGSPRFYTSAATVNFVDGIAKGPPKPFSVSDSHQFSPSFSKVVADARRKMEPEINAVPQSTASSQFGDYGPAGLLAATQPGWHAVQPPKCPESLTLDLRTRREIRLLGLLPQDGLPARAPKAIRVEISDDGNSWTAVAGSDDACAPNTPDGWSNIHFAKPVTTRYLRVIILSNCGDAQLLTLRGLRFE